MTDKFGPYFWSSCRLPSPILSYCDVQDGSGSAPVCGAGRSAWQSSQRRARCETSGRCVAQHGRRIGVRRDRGTAVRAVESRLAGLSSLLNELIQACAVKHVGTDGEHQALPRSVIPAAFVSQSIFHTDGALAVDGCSCSSQQSTVASAEL